MDLTPDRYDLEDGVTAVDKAVEFLRNEGASEPSNYPQWGPGTWYTAEGGQDMHTGGYTNKSYHLEGYTPEEEQAIYAGVTKRRNFVQASLKRVSANTTEFNEKTDTWLDDEPYVDQEVIEKVFSDSKALTNTMRQLGWAIGPSETCVGMIDKYGDKFIRFVQEKTAGKNDNKDDDWSGSAKSDGDPLRTKGEGKAKDENPLGEKDRKGEKPPKPEDKRTKIPSKGHDKADTSPQFKKRMGVSVDEDKVVAGNTVKTVK